MKYKTINEFLSYYANKSTKTVRRSGLLAFIEFVSGNKRTGLFIRKDDFQNQIVEFEQYLKEYMSIENRDYNDDIIKFAVNMNSKKIPPHTAKSYLASVKEYFGQCDIEFSSKQLKDIRNKSPKGGSRTEEDDLTKDIIKQILQYTDVRGRALFLTLISTGARIGEVLQLNLNDLNIKDGKIISPTVLIRGQNTKTGEQRHTFLNKEAIKTIESYLQVREKLRETTLKRTTRSNSEEYKNRLFPFSTATALLIFSFALKTAGLEKFSSSVNRRTFHIHMFRKYFSSQLSVNCPREMVEEIMGHDGYLSSSYRRYTREQMYEYYQAAEHNLYINEIDINKLESEYRKELEISNQHLKARIDEIEQQRMKDQAINEDLIKAMINAKVQEMLKAKGIKE